jgi:hypothetical protein
MDCINHHQGKYSKPVMTQSVTPFRQNRATNALIFIRDESAAPGSSQQFDKTIVICKEETSNNLRWQEKCSKSGAINALSATKEEK